METRAAIPTDRQGVRDLMRTAFGGRDLLAATEPMMSWKYDCPRPGWQSTRAIVAVEGGRIVAHAGVWPLDLSAPGGLVHCVHLIDWVADRACAGAGAAVYMAGQALAPVSIVIGGSEEARRILPKLGFTQAGEMRIHALPLRPWRQFLHRRGCAPARRTALLARNALWRWRAGPASPGRWTFKEVPAFDASHQAWLGSLSASRFTSSWRDPGGLNYLLACPAMPVRATAALEDGEIRALLVLALAGRQMRVADLRVSGETEAAWTRAFGWAACMAMRSDVADELVAGSTTRITCSALAANGFRVRAVKPVWVRDRGRLLEGAPLRLQMSDSDGFLVYDAGDPYLT
jgi:hypothetical protein